MPADAAGQSLRRVLGFGAVVAALLLVIHNAMLRSALERGQGSAIFGDARLLMQAAMRDIAASSARGGPDAAQLAAAVRVARSAPLLPEPFLVAGIAMDEAGDRRNAEALLLAARWRDPRLPVVRYMLGDLYRRDGRDGDAVDELAVLMKVQPQRQLALLPYFAKLAVQPEHREAVRRMALSDPGFGRQLLGAAATEGAPTSFILSVGRQLPAHPENRAWQERLIAKAVEQGDFASARNIFRAVAPRAEASALLVNPTFADESLPAPFNWVFAKSADGVTESQAGGRLSLLYFARNPQIMAGQLLTLPPGRYRLRWKVDVERGGDAVVAWRLTCLPASNILGEVDLGTRSMSFQVMADCPAQRLELAASPGSTLERHAVTIADLSLVRLP